jgi:hypothetical protein
VDLMTGVAQLSSGVDLHVGLLGSAAPGPGTWLWGWANPSSYPDAVLASAQRARAYGQEHDIPELAESEVPLGDSWDATRAAIAATTVAGLRAWLPVQAEGGTQVMLGIESELPPAPPFGEPSRTPRSAAGSSAAASAPSLFAWTFIPRWRGTFRR